MDAEPLLTMIATLRAEGGCPWDRKQRLEDLRGFLVEEAHEVADAIDALCSTGNQPQEAEAEVQELKGELGDLLFQLCFVAELASELELFRPQEIVDSVHQKMIERHPHIWGEATLATAAEVEKAWEQRKAAADPNRSVLAGVPKSLPALMAAYRIGQKASRMGFDWATATEVRQKVDEELAELDAAMASQEQEDIEDELGDLLMTLASLARHLEVEPERALARANKKFRRRFEVIEAQLPAADADAALELWQFAKDAEARNRLDQ